MRLLITADPGVPVPPVLYGGIERIIDGLVRGLIQRGHHVTLLAERGSRVPASRLLGWKEAGILRGMVSLMEAVRQAQPDVIHSFSRLLFLLPQLPMPRLKLMSYQREPTMSSIRKALILSRGTLAFTGCSGYICRQGSRAGGSWTAIPNGVEMSRYKFQHQVPTDAPLFFLSRVERIKGAHTAITVAKRTGRRLVIAGNHADVGDEGRYWRTEIQPHVGKSGIEYIGPVNDVQKMEWLRKSAALLVPVEWEEPFGIVFAEALACGTPVISCPRGALPEIVRHGIDGFLETSVEGLCQAVGRVTALDRAQARRRAEEYFSMDVIVDQYEALYRRLVQS